MKPSGKSLELEASGLMKQKPNIALIISPGHSYGTHRYLKCTNILQTGKSHQEVQNVERYDSHRLLDCKNTTARKRQYRLDHFAWSSMFAEKNKFTQKEWAYTAVNAVSACGRIPKQQLISCTSSKPVAQTLCWLAVVYGPIEDKDVMVG